MRFLSDMFHPVVDKENPSSIRAPTGKTLNIASVPSVSDSRIGGLTKPTGNQRKALGDVNKANKARQQKAEQGSSKEFNVSASKAIDRFCQANVGIKSIKAVSLESTKKALNEKESDGMVLAESRLNGREARLYETKPEIKQKPVFSMDDEPEFMDLHDGSEDDYCDIFCNPADRPTTYLDCLVKWRPRRLVPAFMSTGFDSDDDDMPRPVSPFRFNLPTVESSKVDYRDLLKEVEEPPFEDLPPPSPLPWTTIM